MKIRIKLLIAILLSINIVEAQKLKSIKLDMGFFKIPENLLEPKSGLFKINIESERNDDYTTGEILNIDLENIYLRGFKTTNDINSADFNLKIIFNKFSIVKMDIEGYSRFDIKVLYNFPVKYEVIKNNGQVFAEGEILEKSEQYYVKLSESGIYDFTEAQLNNKLYMEKLISKNSEEIEIKVLKHILNKMYKYVEYSLYKNHSAQSFYFTNIIPYVKKNKKYKIDDSWELKSHQVRKIFERINFGLSPEKAEIEFAPYIEFWNSEFKRFNIKKKRERKIIGSIALNLMNFYFWSYNFDEAKKLYQKYKDLKFKYDDYFTSMGERIKKLESEKKGLERIKKTRKYACENFMYLLEGDKKGSITFSDGTIEKGYFRTNNNRNDFYSKVVFIKLKDFMSEFADAKAKTYDTNDINEYTCDGDLYEKITITLDNNKSITKFMKNLFKGNLNLYEYYKIGYHDPIKYYVLKKDNKYFALKDFDDLIEKLNKYSNVCEKLKNGDYNISIYTPDGKSKPIVSAKNETLISIFRDCAK